MRQTATRIFFVLTAFLLLSAFRHTDIEGYTDPNYPDYGFRTVVVHLPNASISFRKAVVTQLRNRFKRLKITVLEHDTLFPPTRAWNEDSSREVYVQHHVDAGLVITLGSAGSETTPGGVLYNASTVGGTSTGYATQVQYMRDHASFEIALVDVISQDTVWFGRLDTQGAGLLFVGEKNTAKALAKGLIKEWKSGGQLSRR